MKRINTQLSQLDGSNEPDYIWKGINRPQPQLYRFLKILVNLSSSFYIVSDLSIYTRNRLRSIIEQPFNSATELLERIKTNLFSFTDIAPRGDDVTMLAVHRVSRA